MRVVELIYDAACFVKNPGENAHIVLLMADGHMYLCEEVAEVGRLSYAIETSTRPEYQVCRDCLNHMEGYIGTIRESINDE